MLVKPWSISKFGLRSIERREGRRYSVYLDSAGKPTIGVGHLLRGPYKPDLTWSEEEVQANLAIDAKIAEDCINQCVIVPLSQPQYDSLISFVFNVGEGAFRQSTMLKKINSSDYEGAAKEFLRWVIPPELINRRQQEMGVFLYGSEW